MARDYTYDTKYESSPKQIANRVKRNAARREMLRRGLVHKGDRKDVHHIHGMTNNNKNLTVLSAHRNRSMK